MRDTTPQELAIWRRHFQRYPPDEVPRLLSALISMQCVGESRPSDADIRPYAYAPSEHRARAAREEEKRVERAAVAGARFQASFASMMEKRTGAGSSGG